MTSDLVGLEDLDEEDVFLDCDNEQAAAAAREEEEGEGEGEEDGLAAIRSRSVSRQKLCSGRSRPSSSLRVGVVTTPTQPGVGPLQSSTPQLQEQPQAISLNNIIDSPTELEYFKVLIIIHVRTCIIMHIYNVGALPLGGMMHVTCFVTGVPQ